MEIRRLEEGDIEAIWRLFKDTILSVNIRDYSKEQCEVWSHSFSNIEDMSRRLENCVTVAADLDGEIVGFGSLNDQRQIDLLYTHKNFQGRGIGSALLQELESVAYFKRYEELSTEASITARDFFLSKGYQEVRKQIKRVRGSEFINFIMKKKL
jgi:putative acetyltransferase